MLNRNTSERRFEVTSANPAMLFAAIESSSYPIITVTPEGLITTWNPAAEQLYQYAAARAVGSHITLIVPPDRHDEQRSVLTRALSGEPTEALETVRLASDGRRIDVSLNIQPVTSASGDIVGVVKISRDITAQKLAEEKFRLAVELCPNGMIMTESSGKIVLVNRSIERMFGYGRDELLGQGIDVLVPERSRGQHVAHRQSFAHGPEARQMGSGRELFGRRKDGSEFPVEVGLNPIDTREGTLVLGVVIDISERKRIEALKAEFVSTVSHELRTPLTSISASLALLAGATTIKLPEPAKRLVTIAHSNSARLVRLVNDILDVEKLESGKIVFDVKRTEVGALVGQAIEVNRAVADSRGVVIRLEASASYEVRTDPDRLMQVITNLLSNAIKFSPAAAEVNVGIERRGRWVRIAVVDHGQGIPEAFKPHIFEKFAQADASNARQMGGTGLGLSIVKEIVQRLGGQVGFSDTPGGGATFHVDLPIAETAAGLTVAAQRDARARCPVLLCEDDREVADKLQDRLLQAGFATDLALTAAEALARAESRAYSTILIDLLLPDADGITLIQQLRAQPQHAATPIIVVSADPAKGRGDLQSSNLNVLDWLSKPLDVSRLVRTIEPAIVRQSSPPLSVLHLDDDPEVLRIVANALNQNARVVSVASVDAGRVALEHRKIDLAILDLALDGRSGLDLLPDLHDGAGNAIPVIVYSARGANPACAAQVQAALTKSRDSIDSLIAILHSRVACAIEER